MFWIKADPDITYLSMLLAWGKTSVDFSSSLSLSKTRTLPTIQLDH